MVMERVSDAIYMDAVREDFRLTAHSFLAEWVSFGGRQRGLDALRNEVEEELEKRRVLLSREDDRDGFGFYGVLYRAESRTYLLLWVQLTVGLLMKDLYLLRKKLDLSGAGFKLVRVERKRKSVLRDAVESYWKSVVEKVLGDGEVESVMVGDARMSQRVSDDVGGDVVRKRELMVGSTPSVDEVSGDGGLYSVGMDVIRKRRRKELRMAEMAVELRELEIEEKRAEVRRLEQQLEAERAEVEKMKVEMFLFWKGLEAG